MERSRRRREVTDLQSSVISKRKKNMLERTNTKLKITIKDGRVKGQETLQLKGRASWGED